MDVRWGSRLALSLFFLLGFGPVGSLNFFSVPKIFVQLRCLPTLTLPLQMNVNNVFAFYLTV